MTNHEPTGFFVVIDKGDPVVGDTLTARPNAIKDADGIDYATQAFLWLADGEPIPGATSQAYVPTSEDRGKWITVEWSYTDLKGKRETVVSKSLGGFAVDDNMRNLRGLYRLALKRDPDGPGLLFWADHYQTLVDAGLTTWDAAEAVVAAFSESDDFARETA